MDWKGYNEGVAEVRVRKSNQIGVLINYLLSLHILQMLKRENLITEEEFTAIDHENKKSFLTTGEVLLTILSSLAQVETVIVLYVP